MSGNGAKAVGIYNEKSVLLSMIIIIIIFPTMENEIVAFMLDKFLDSWESLESLAGTPAVLLQHEHPSVL